MWPEWKRLREWIGAGIVALVIAKLFDLIVDRISALNWAGVVEKVLSDPPAHVLMAMLGTPLVLLVIYLKRYKWTVDDFEFIAQLWFAGMATGFLAALSVHFVRGTTAPIVASLEADPIATCILLWVTCLYLVGPIIRTLFGLPPFSPKVRR